MPIAEPALTLYIKEDSRRMSLNERATLRWWLLTPHVRGQDLVVGTAILVPEDESSVALLEQLHGQDRFLVEVQIAEAIGEWVAGARRFGTWFEAARFALALVERFSFIVATRVISV